MKTIERLLGFQNIFHVVYEEPIVTIDKCNDVKIMELRGFILSSPALP